MTYADRVENCRMCGADNPPQRRFYCSTACKKRSRDSVRRAERSGDRTQRLRANTRIRAALANEGPRAALYLVQQSCDASPEGCWLWNGGMSMKGYPSMGVDGKTMYTHRLTWEWANGRRPTMTIHHACGNSRCVNPDHLQEVTQRDNIAEMYERRAYQAEIAALKVRVAELEAQIALYRGGAA